MTLSRSRWPGSDGANRSPRSQDTLVSAAPLSTGHWSHTWPGPTAAARQRPDNTGVRARSPETLLQDPHDEPFRRTSAVPSQARFSQLGGAQRPPSAGVELGQFGFDVDGDDAEEVDVLRMAGR